MPRGTNFNNTQKKLVGSGMYMSWKLLAEMTGNYSIDVCHLSTSANRFKYMIAKQGFKGYSYWNVTQFCYQFNV